MILMKKLLRIFKYAKSIFVPTNQNEQLRFAHKFNSTKYQVRFQCLFLYLCSVLWLIVRFTLTLALPGRTVLAGTVCWQELCKALRNRAVLRALYKYG